TLGAVQLAIPRWFAEWYFGSYSVALFTAATHLTVLTGLVVTGVGQSISAPLARCYAANDNVRAQSLLRYLVLIAIAVSGAIALLTVTVGQSALRQLYGPQYANAYNLACGIAIFAPISALSSCAGFALTSARVFTAQLPILLLSVLA